MRKVIPVVVLLAGCTEMLTLPSLPTLTPYKIDIQQGNYVTQDMVEKLKPGMTRAQVRFVLGTPLVVDPFHTDRWDYVYTFRKAGEMTEQRRFSVIFKDDQLLRLDGDVTPAKPKTAVDVSVGADKPKPVAAEPKREAGAPAKAQSAKPEAVAPPAAAPEFKGSVLTTTSGQPVVTSPQTAPPPKAESGTEKPKENEPQEEKGFFGRMLEKLGF